MLSAIVDPQSDLVITQQVPNPIEDGKDTLCEYFSHSKNKVSVTLLETFILFKCSWQMLLLHLHGTKMGLSRILLHN